MKNCTPTLNGFVILLFVGLDINVIDIDTVIDVLNGTCSPGPGLSILNQLRAAHLLGLTAGSMKQN